MRNDPFVCEVCADEATMEVVQETVVGMSREQIEGDPGLAGHALRFPRPDGYMTADHRPSRLTLSMDRNGICWRAEHG
jgi:hypothetical protein